MKYYLKLLSVPLLLLVLSLSLRIFWDIFSLPSAESLAKTAEVWFQVYGLPVIFLSSMIEGMLLVGGYFPGVFMIFLGVIFSTSLVQAGVVVSVVTAGLLIAHVINYFLGKYGWYRLLVKFGLKDAIDSERDNVLRQGVFAIFASYWLPSAAAITDTAAGITQMPFKKFALYSLIFSVFWDVLAGTLIYFFKDSAMSIVDPGSSGGLFFYSIVGVWMAILLVSDFYKKYKSKT